MRKEKKITVKPKKLSICLTSPVDKVDYDKDFSKWAHNQAKFLKKREFSKLDMDHLIEEIEDLSKREKQRLTSYLENLLIASTKSSIST